MKRFSGSNPAKLDMVLTLTSAEVLGTLSEVPIHILADLDVPQGVVQVKIPGPDGISGTSDDGILAESFDLDRDNSGAVEIDSRCSASGPGCADPTAGIHNDTIGVTVRTTPGGIGGLAGIGCGGFNVPPADPGCIIDPDNDMDWHIHCPAGTCPPPHVAGSSTAFSATPAGGAMAFSGSNSLHWGRHTSATDRKGDSVSFRSLAAFMTTVNLTPLPQAGDLSLGFYHIADMMDNNQADLPKGMAVDYGDVQIPNDLNADPLI